MKITLLVMLFTGITLASKAQKVKFDFINPKNFQTQNRGISFLKDRNKNIIYMDSAQNDGIAWLNNIDFQYGTIELDIKGRNVLQKSFVGLAFHGLDSNEYEVVHFRPFNFKSDDKIRRSHSVQYINSPDYEWKFLRENYPDKYENKLTREIDPDSWFHVKIVINRDSVFVFVDNDKKPSLRIKPFKTSKGKKIGLWVGNNSPGYFSNLTIKNN